MGSAKTMGDIINKYYDNSTENMGAYNSFINYGTAPFPERHEKCLPLY